MFHRLFAWSWIVLVVIAAPAIAAEVSDADASLAARFADFGTDLLRQRKVQPAEFDACESLLKAANKLNPAEARYPRLLAEACLATRDVDGAIAALKTFRQISPEDQAAQLQLVELNLQKMETVDAKLAYANQILTATSVAAEVRSAIAVIAAGLASERGQHDQAATALDQALRLNPLNVEALRMRYAEGGEELSDFQRVRLLIATLRANPIQPAAVGELAQKVADMGLVKPALEWYFQAILVHQRLGVAIPADLAVNFGAEQFLAERYDAADGMAIQLLQGDPNDVDALYLRLLCARNTADKLDNVSTRNLARRTLLGQLKKANEFVLDPTSRPATVRAVVVPPPAAVDALGLPIPGAVETEVPYTLDDLPDASPILAKLNQPDAKPETRVAYVGLLTDLAWYTLYFDPNPQASDKLLETLGKLLPEDNVALVRLQGWNYLQQGKNNEAKNKLSAVADRDPLAALGLALLSPVSDTDANNRARKLLADNPSRMIGAFIKESLRDRGVKVVAREEAQQIASDLASFPVKWMSIIDRPADFYAVTAEPLQGQYDYREPILVRVTLQNMSEFDITIGRNGVLHSDLWMDGDLRGVKDQSFPGTAFERITSSNVLRARQSVSQIVRVDQGELQKVLLKNPTSPQQIFLTVFTNPVSTRDGSVGAGPAGYRVALKKLIARAGFSINSEKAVGDLREGLVNGNLGRFNKMDLMAAYIRDARNNPADEALNWAAGIFRDTLIAVRVDASPSVRGWARYLSLTLAAADTRKATVQELVRSNDWTTRLLGAIGANQLEEADRQATLAELSSDAEPLVQEYAAAMAKVTPSATTQPASQPADEKVKP